MGRKQTLTNTTVSPTKLHHDRVLAVGSQLIDLGKVCADLDSSYTGCHTFAPAFDPLNVPELFLSALVPSQTVFTSAIGLNNPDWGKPDLAVTQDGFAYLLDVFGDNDSDCSVARKIETVIVNAAARKIVGLALIAKGVRKPYEKKKADQRRLRRTFHALFGPPTDSWDEENKCRYLKILFARDPFRSEYGDICWDRVLELTYTEDNKWVVPLRAHISAALTSKQVMTRQSDEIAAD
jgi:hypothetical protein